MTQADQGFGCQAKGAARSMTRVQPEGVCLKNSKKCVRRVGDVRGQTHHSELGRREPWEQEVPKRVSCGTAAQEGDAP